MEEFTMDQDFIEVPSGEGVEVGDHLGLVAYMPDGKRFPAWSIWVEVLEIHEHTFTVRFLGGSNHIFPTLKDRTNEQNKWVKKITTRDYKADQEPIDDEELL